MKLSSLFTEYDENVTGGINLDPLGMLVIWSAYGQRIFKNRVNSISNDVRNYTLNLFHHYVIRKIILDEGIALSEKLKRRMSSKDSPKFKDAAIVYLENLFVYSMLSADSNVDTRGVLGASKGRKKWEESDENPLLIFSDETKAYILVRQLLLGVSGRYKSPMIEMGLYDKSYNYSIPEFAGRWGLVEEFINTNIELRQLTEVLIGHLKQLILANVDKPEKRFSEVESNIKDGYRKCFKNSKTVGTYSRKFWLSLTELDKGASGAILDVIENSVPNAISSVKDTFLQAKKVLSESSNSYWDIDNIETLEPFLADVGLLFNLLRSKPTVTLQEVEQEWKALGRDVKTLSVQAYRIYMNDKLQQGLRSTGKKRLSTLLHLKDKKSLQDQIELILNYHKQVMRERGQSEWVSNKNEEYKALIRLKRKPTKTECPPGYWLNKYYLPQFRNLVSGLQGETA